MYIRKDLSRSRIGTHHFGGGSREPVFQSLSKNKMAHLAQMFTTWERESAFCLNSYVNLYILKNQKKGFFSISN